MSQFSDAEWPTAAGSVFGLRSWQIIGDSRQLFGFKSGLWIGPSQKARCLDADARDSNWHVSESAPYKDCNCGIYAYWKTSEILAATNAVTGIIEGSGRTIIGDKGFRCEYACIVGFAANPFWKRRMKELVYSFHVPVYDNMNALLEAYQTTSGYSYRDDFHS